jgi:hypothetical protein
VCVCLISGDRLVEYKVDYWVLFVEFTSYIYSKTNENVAVFLNITNLYFPTQ